MKTPYLEVNLSKLYSNARNLISIFGEKNINITGVTKCFLGDVKIAKCLVSAGISSLGDSRIDNIIRMKKENVQAQFTLLRIPSISEIDDVITYTDVSFNSELAVIDALSKCALARNQTHNIILMVEEGDLREGILPRDLGKTIEEVLKMKGIRILGLGTNLACLNGVKPTRKNMDHLSRLVDECEKNYGIKLDRISGGNSANVNWMFETHNMGRVNNIRIGEAILLGKESLSRMPINGLHLDAFTLVAEVIESKVKPSLPEGESGQDAFGNTPIFRDQGEMLRSIAALGKQDVNVAGLVPMMDIDILGSSSDHIVLDSTKAPLHVGDQVQFSLDYGALLSSMTSPFIDRVYS